MNIRPKITWAIGALASCMICGTAGAQNTATTPGAVPAPEVPGTPLQNPPVTDDGTITVPFFQLPFSSFASPEARQAYVRMLHNTRQITSTDAREAMRLVQENYAPMMERVKVLYPYTSTRAPIGGVDAETFVPAAGVAPENKDRVLISLGGGGTAPTSALGAAPIAGLGRITVISVNTRLPPKYKFPAIDEDLEAVYRMLLKTHKPENIGFYGCSGGGQMVGAAMAWFEKQKLPMPGAIGIYCAGLYPFGQGDSEQIWVRLGHGGRSIVPRKPITDWEAAKPTGYFEGQSYMDPLVRPSASQEVMSHFPPTLLLTGTRADDMSVAVQTNLDLLDAGVDSRLVLFEGMGHGFFADPDLPESRLAYKIMVQWFEQNLGKRRKG